VFVALKRIAKIRIFSIIKIVCELLIGYSFTLYRIWQFNREVVGVSRGDSDILLCLNSKNTYLPYCKNIFELDKDFTIFASEIKRIAYDAKTIER
jgi:hypothetical protein